MIDNNKWRMNAGIIINREIVDNKGTNNKTIFPGTLRGVFYIFQQLSKFGLCKRSPVVKSNPKQSSF